jgi:hypothetical protein
MPHPPAFGTTAAVLGALLLSCSSAMPVTVSEAMVADGSAIPQLEIVLIAERARLLVPKSTCTDGTPLCVLAQPACVRFLSHD